MDRISELATRHNVPLDVAKDFYNFGVSEARKASINDVHANAADIVLGSRLYEEAASNGMSLSAYLESIDPSAGYKDGMDAFERQLMLSNIKTRSVPEMGLWADKVERFWDAESVRPGASFLLPEFMTRTWRRAATPSMERFYASSNPVSDVLKPDWINTEVRQKKIAPAIPLSAIVAITTPIDTDVYKAFYLTDSEASRQMKRVGEGAEFPTVTLTGGDHTINLKKYGRRLEASYESIRRLRIDRFALHLGLLAVQAEVDKVNTAIDIMLNGDGNSGTTPTNSNLTTLDTAAVADTLTLKGYLAWLQLWANPYKCDVILARSAYALQVMLLNSGSANLHLMNIDGKFGIGGVTPINGTLGPVGLGHTTSVTDKYLLGFDSRFTVEMIQEIGTTLTETNRIVSRQMDEIVMSEVCGFAIMDANPLRTMNVNA